MIGRIEDPRFAG